MLQDIRHRGLDFHFSLPTPYLKSIYGHPLRIFLELPHSLQDLELLWDTNRLQYDLSNDLRSRVPSGTEIRFESGPYCLPVEVIVAPETHDEWKLLHQGKLPIKVTFPYGRPDVSFGIHHKINFLVFYHGDYFEQLLSNYETEHSTKGL